MDVHGGAIVIMVEEHHGPRFSVTVQIAIKVIFDDADHMKIGAILPNGLAQGTAHAQKFRKGVGNDDIGAIHGPVFLKAVAFQEIQVYRIEKAWAYISEPYKYILGVHSSLPP